MLCLVVGKRATATPERPVTISLRDARNSRSARLWIQSVYRDYVCDLTPDSTAPPELAALEQIAHWFRDPQLHPLLILKSSEPVGFAMVAKAASRHASQPVDYRMKEFFIARTCRRLGIGRSAVELILNRFAGRWEIAQQQKNAAAVSFWRRVVGRYTCGNYQERIVNDEVRQLFDSARRQS
jgi:predicted acetyltransferase